MWNNVYIRLIISNQLLMVEPQNIDVTVPVEQQDLANIVLEVMQCRTQNMISQELNPTLALIYQTGFVNWDIFK